MRLSLGQTASGSWGPLFVWIWLVVLSGSAHAVIETYEFSTPEEEARYEHFIEVLRCPKCQNQNLAGSDSPISADLRRELARQIREGKTDREIVDFMVARYGDFILYDPPLKQGTWLLWFAPGLLLLAGLVILYRMFHSEPRPGAETQEQNEVSPASLPSSGHRGPSLVLGLSLLAVALGSWLLYQQLGASDVLEIGEMTRGFYAKAADPAADPAALRAMARELLSRLEARRAGRPEGEALDSEALQLLYLSGSLHAYLSEFEQAVPYYRDYLMAMPADEAVLTEYVQVLYLASGRQLTERVRFVAARALELNPHNPEVLALLALHGE